MYSWWMSYIDVKQDRGINIGWCTTSYRPELKLVYTAGCIRGPYKI